MKLDSYTIERLKETSTACIVTGKMGNDDFVYFIVKTSCLEQVDDKLVEKMIEEEQTSKRIEATFRTVLTYPATKKHIDKYFTEKQMVVESWEEYEELKKLTEIPWIDNIFKEDITEGERIFYRDDDYAVIADNKWNGNVDELYYLVLFKDKRLESLRNLDETHLELLKKIRTKIFEIIRDRHNLNQEDVCLFFHYLPSHFRLHIHVVNISKTTLCLYDCFRSILLDDVIKNIEIDKDYYKQEMYFLY